MSRKGLADHVGEGRLDRVRPGRWRQRRADGVGGPRPRRDRVAPSAGQLPHVSQLSIVFFGARSEAFWNPQWRWCRWRRRRRAGRRGGRAHGNYMRYTIVLDEELLPGITQHAHVTDRSCGEALGATADLPSPDVATPRYSDLGNPVDGRRAALALVDAMLTRRCTAQRRQMPAAHPQEPPANLASPLNSRNSEWHTCNQNHAHGKWSIGTHA
jgi:hypothetical protein